MDFQTARGMFEENAVADAPSTTAGNDNSDVTRKSSTALHGAVSPAAARARAALVPRPPPVLPVAHPNFSSDLNDLDNESDVYSAVGDYAADDEFFVAGVNDETSSSHACATALNGHASRSTSTADSADRRFSQRSEDYGSLPLDISDGDYTPSNSGNGHDYDVDDTPVEVVRQHSNFSRLSAQSWLTVDSAQEVEVPSRSVPFSPQSPVVIHSTTSQIPTRTYSSEADHNPATLFNIDKEGQLLQSIHSKPLLDKSIFECCVVLQAGVAAYKKKSFRRFGARRVWLSAGCDRLLWTSKKSGLPADHIKLQKVAKMKCVDREVSIDVSEGYRISLLFGDSEEAGLWVRALSCLIPLQARVRAPHDIMPPDKEREDFNLADDVFNSIPLRQYKCVNSHVVLCCARGQPQNIGNKLAFSRSDGSFCSLRYVPHAIVPLLLRSQEEIAVLKRLDHPNIVKYHECLLDEEHGGNYIIFEYLARGTLIDSTRLEGITPIPEKAARNLIWDVLNALEYLHTLRIAHGDVRPDNLLRAVNGSVKLNAIGCITHDFTQINNLPALVKARLGDASPAFLAPELCWLSDAPEAHPKSYAMDVWAVGVVLYFMLYGRVPFGGHDDAEIQASICKRRLRFPRQPETSRKVRSLLKGVLGEKDPKTRIGLSELKGHPWFTEGERYELEDAVGNSYKAVRLIVSLEEVDSAVQVAKV